MGEKQGLNRRKFMKLGGAALVGGLLASGCGSQGGAPAVAKKPTVTLGANGYSLNSFRTMLQELGFTKQTGIELNFSERPNASNECTTKMTSAIRAGSTPYDVLNFEDELAVPFARAGWLVPLDDVIAPEVWEDFTPELLAMTKTWDQYKGETFRVHHNFEATYFWYRKDWFDAKGLEPPRTWDEVAQMGKVFNDKSKGIWATEDGMTKGATLNVYLAWVARQAGGNLYDVDDSLRTALQYIHDLMYKHETMNPASLQKDYDQQNGDYLGDRVAFMRQWPFVYDVARKEQSWYSEEKLTCILPPVGPGGKAVSTYAAGWGFGIPKTSRNIEAAKELIRFMISKENVVKMIDYSTWFLNARHSVLKAAGNEGFAKFLKMYTDAGVISTRPHHPKYGEAVSILEDAGSAFLSNQVSLDETMKRTKEKMERIAEA
jgi:ABC-type glycerol-3-phosphate transport system substrate-binding protein